MSNNYQLSTETAQRLSRMVKEGEVDTPQTAPNQSASPVQLIQVSCKNPVLTSVTIDSVTTQVYLYAGSIVRFNSSTLAYDQYAGVSVYLPDPTGLTTNRPTLQNSCVMLGIGYGQADDGTQVFVCPSTGFLASFRGGNGFRVGRLSDLSTWTLVSTSAWSSAATYQVGELISDGSKIYYALQTSTNKTPSSFPLYWWVVTANLAQPDDNCGLFEVVIIPDAGTGILTGLITDAAQTIGGAKTVVNDFTVQSCNEAINSGNLTITSGNETLIGNGTSTGFTYWRQIPIATDYAGAGSTGFSIYTALAFYDITVELTGGGLLIESNGVNYLGVIIQDSSQKFVLQTDSDAQPCFEIRNGFPIGTTTFTGIWKSTSGLIFSGGLLTGGSVVIDVSGIETDIENALGVSNGGTGADNSGATAGAALVSNGSGQFVPGGLPSISGYSTALGMMSYGI